MKNERRQVRMKNEKKGSKDTEWKEIKVRMKNENKGSKHEE